MTKEEARDQIVIFMCDEQKVINDRDKQALDMAIEALEQKSCGDTISRADAMRAITDEWVRTYGNHTLEGFTDAIYNLPPVIPERAESEGEG